MPDLSEHAEFERGVKDYLDAFNSGDYEKVASYWTDDAVSCPPIGEEIRGRAALREFYRQTFEHVAPRLSDYTFECRFSGDVVFVRESWRFTISLPGQEPQDRRGRGLWVGKKEADGVWRALWSLGRFDA
jgi:uncharacterized protein (TIGR02246 family)